MARDRSLKLIIQAQVDGAKRALRETADAAKKVGEASEQASKRADTAAGRMVQSARDNRQAWDTAGTTLAGFGAAATLALGGASKAAIDWETSWAGVTKTVGEAEAASVGLDAALREMARELPASHSEIAAVAEAAGQLGIQAPNIEGFTRTMIDLGEATNLSADEAATALARFANIMGTSQLEFSNIGSAVVELGNNFATTEREIVEMGLRLAGAGRQAGLSEGEVLGLATALSSVGIEAEAGGTAFSRVLIEMGSAVDTQSGSLETFARVAGMSAEQFSQAWGEDPGSAISAFISGMGRIDASGQSVQPILEELGMTDIRIGDALRRSAAAADLFTGAMDTGNDAYAANIALTEEAAQRYATVESRMSMARNAIVDAGTSLGEVFLPAIGSAADGVADLAGFLADLPPGLQGIVAGLTGTAGVVGLTSGAFFLMTPRIIESYQAFKDIAGISPRVSSGLGRVATVTAKGGMLVTGLVALGGALQMIDQATWKAAPGVEEVRGALLDLQETSDPARLNEMVASLDIDANGMLGGRINNIGDAFDRLANPSLQQRLENMDKVFGWRTSADQALGVIEPLDQLLAEMATTSEGAAAASELLAAMLDGSKTSVEQALEDLPAYRDALAGLDNNAREAAGSTSELAEATNTLAGTMIALPEGMPTRLDLMREGADALATSIGEAAGGFDIFGEKIGDAEVSLDGWLESIAANAAARDAWVENMRTLAQAGLDEGFYAALIEQGEAGAGRVQEMVDALADGTDISEFNEIGRKAGLETAQGLAEEIGETQFPTVDLEAAVDRAQLYEELTGALHRTSAEIEPAQLQSTLDVNVDPARVKTAETVLWAMEQTGIMNLDADSLGADLAIAEWNALAASTTGLSTLDSDPAKAKAQLAAWKANADATLATAELYADISGANGETARWQAWADSVSATATVGAYTDPAVNAVSGILGWIARQSATVSVYARMAGGLNMGGSARTMVSARASGGVERRPMLAGPQYGRTNMILWGEPETRGEAFISNHPNYRQQNIDYLRTAASWFGMDVVKAYAAGGVARQWTSPARQMSVSASASLAAEDRALLQAVASRPVSVAVDSREIARADMRGRHRLGAPATWSGGPRVGREAQ